MNNLNPSTIRCMHQWNGANELLKAAPTISQHLGHQLVLGGSYGMSSFSKRLLCKGCGKLTWTALTRVRKRRRIAHGRRNQVIQRCETCNAMRKESGSFTRRGSNSSAPMVLESNAGQGKAPGSARAKKAVLGTKGKMSSSNGSTNSKKTRQASASNRCSDAGNRQNFARPIGLATSFLFEDIEE